MTNLTLWGYGLQSPLNWIMKPQLEPPKNRFRALGSRFTSIICPRSLCHVESIFFPNERQRESTRVSAYCVFLIIIYLWTLEWVQSLFKGDIRPIVVKSI